MKRCLPAVALLSMCWAFAAQAAAPPDPTLFAYLQRPGSLLPTTAFTDEAGREVTLRQVAGGLPMVLALGYYRCPNLCGIVRSDLFNALDATHLVAGRDYSMVSVSIDPAEGPAEALAAKTEDIAHFPAAGAAEGWHFLTGAEPAIHALAESVGFQDRFDADSRQFMHPAGLVFIAPSGKVSGYLLGVGYNAGDVAQAITAARTGSLMAAAQPILLLCFHFDAATGRYSLEIMKLLQIAAVVTVLGIATLLGLLSRRGRR